MRRLYGPKRHPTHIMEEASKLKLQVVRPREWTIQFGNPDYGIDAFMLPFRDGVPTGQLLVVQLKSVAKPHWVGDAIALPIDADVLALLESVPNPILVIIHDQEKDELHYLDLQTALASITKTWDRQATLTVHVPRANRLATEADFWTLLATLPPPRVPGPWDKKVAHHRRVWQLAIEATVEGRLAGLEDAWKAAGLTPNDAWLEEARAAILARGPVVLERRDGAWAVGRPSIPGLVALLDSQSPHLIPFLANNGWLPALEPETVGKLVALYVQRGDFPPHVVAELEAHRFETFVSAVQFLLAFAPDKARDLPQVRIESEAWSPAPGAPSTAIKHRLTFTSATTQQRFASIVARVGQRQLILVPVQQTGYVVEIEILQAGDGPCAVLAFQGRGPAANQTEGAFEGPQPKVVQLRRVRARLAPRTQPFAIAYYNGRPGGLPTITLNDAQFTVIGGQHYHKQLHPKGGSQLLVGDFIVVRQFENQAADRIPEAMPGRKRVAITGTEANPGLQGVAFVQLDNIPQPPSELLAELRKRYQEVR